MVATVVLFGLVLTATATDLARHKIYNWLTYPGILAALALNVVGSLVERSTDSAAAWRQFWGWVGLPESLAGCLLCGFVMLVCFVFFRVGGGDVKMMAMLGAFLGPYQGIDALLWTFVLGAALGLVTLIWRVGLWTLVVRTLRQVVWSLRLGGFSPLAPEERRQLQPPLYLAPSALAALIVMRWLPA